jgi:hypothetical protein
MAAQLIRPKGVLWQLDILTTRARLVRQAITLAIISLSLAALKLELAR